MPAARDTDWTHVRVVGERDAAAPYLSFARKLLGFVKQDAAYNGLMTHSATKRLPDGAVVVAEIHGTIPRITIVPPPQRPAPPPGNSHENFVVTPRNVEHPDGVDSEHPQIMLRRDGGGDWRTLFFDKTAATYGAVAAPKGTYRTSNGLVGFPDGVKHAGNVDWRSADGVRVSWYGPSSRYWYDGWRQPSAQYGRFVFMLGQVLLDVDVYCTNSHLSLSNRLVMGAALDVAAMRLYVMQAALSDQANEVPASIPTFAVTPPSPTGDIPLSLVRYSLRIDQGVDGVMRYVVVPNSHEILWDGLLLCACNPWFFNQSITRAVSYSVPDKVGVAVTVELSAGTGPGGYDVTRYEPVSASGLRFDARVDGANSGVTQTAVALPAGVGSAPIATDFADNDREVEVSIARMEAGLNDKALVMLIDGEPLWLYYHNTSIYPSNPDLFNYTTVYWVDARSRAFASRYSQHLLFDNDFGEFTSSTNGMYSTGKFSADGAAAAIDTPPFQNSEYAPSGVHWHTKKYFVECGADFASAPSAWLYAAVLGQFGGDVNAVAFNGFGCAPDSFVNAPAAQMFGGASDASIPGGSTLFTDHFVPETDPVTDDESKRWLFGAAAFQGEGVFSTRLRVITAALPGFPSVRDLKVAMLTHGNLAERTGVSNTDANHAPVWLLGTIPQQLLQGLRT